MKILILALFCFISTTIFNPIFGQKIFQKVEVDTIFKDKISIRAILVDKNKVWYAANDNRFGYFDLKTQKRNEVLIKNDSLKMEFRSIAQTDDSIFILNVGNPANLFLINKLNLDYKLVYKEIHEKVFYDSMQFFNNKDGIAIGDPITDCFSIIKTQDGGKTWHKISCGNLPKIVDGEAAFAASNTNIVIKKNKIWVVSGGIKSRVFYSENKGKTWQVIETPIIQGEKMTGIFTADFYDPKIGIIAGGNYEKPNQNFGNKALTSDGGKTWKLISENDGFGYASCIQFIPKSNGNQIISVGISGIFYSSNKGENWKKLSDDSTLFTIRFIDSKTAVAAGKNKMILIKLE